MKITLKLKYKELKEINGWRIRYDEIIFDSKEQLMLFISGKTAYDEMDNAICKKDDEILLYAEDENKNIIWENKED